MLLLLHFGMMLFKCFMAFKKSLSFLNSHLFVYMFRRKHTVLTVSSYCTLMPFKWNSFSIDWSFANEVTMVHNNVVNDNDDEWLRSVAVASFYFTECPLVMEKVLKWVRITFYTRLKFFWEDFEFYMSAPNIFRCPSSESCWQNNSQAFSMIKCKSWLKFFSI